MQNNPFDAIPEIQFTPHNVEKIRDEMISDYEEEFYKDTGQRISVPLASKERIFLSTQAYRFSIAYGLIDQGLKMNLLKYSTGAYLENLASLFGMKRLLPQPSVSKVEFTLSKEQQTSITIPQGTRVSTGTSMFFETVETLTIPAGKLTGQVDIKSSQAGSSTTGISKGNINIIVDPIPYVQSVENIFPTQGGTDGESDEGLRLRVYHFKDMLSVAGPESAYIYFIRSFSPSIEGVKVTSPSPGVVEAKITLSGGELPEQPFISSLMEFLKDKRPLTDQLKISAPDKKEYGIEVTYYLATSVQGNREQIEEQIQVAVEQYILWQGAEIGRDISPDMLTKMMMEAGAKRVPITEPVFTPVKDTEIAVLQGEPNVIFGGWEDD